MSKMANDLDYIINHVFLTQKLPQEDDSNTTEAALLAKEVSLALKLYKAHIPTRDHEKLTWCIKMVDDMLQTRDDYGGLVAKEIRDKLGDMVDGGACEPACENIADIQYHMCTSR
jgi:hypothetical protein